MEKTRTFPFRYTFYAVSLAGFFASLMATPVLGGWFYLVPLLFSILSVLGTWDLLQRKHTVSRNYPILAHFRYFLESIGPEIRQYFIQSDTDERPFSREQRTIVYQRAKNVLDKRPFGSQLGMYDEGFEWINHSMRPVRITDSGFRIVVANTAPNPTAPASLTYRP